MGDVGIILPGGGHCRAFGIDGLAHFAVATDQPRPLFDHVYLCFAGLIADGAFFGVSFKVVALGGAHGFVVVATFFEQPPALQIGAVVILQDFGAFICVERVTRRLFIRSPSLGAPSGLSMRTETNGSPSVTYGAEGTSFAFTRRVGIAMIEFQGVAIAAGIVLDCGHRRRTYKLHHGIGGFIANDLMALNHVQGQVPMDLAGSKTDVASKATICRRCARTRLGPCRS